MRETVMKFRTIIDSKRKEIAAKRKELIGLLHQFVKHILLNVVL